MLGSLNTWSIIQFTNKIIDHGDFDEVHKVVIDSISDNMASLAQVGKYGAISAEYPTTIGYNLMKYLPEPYTLQEYQTIYGQVSKAGEFLVEA